MKERGFSYDIQYNLQFGGNDGLLHTSQVVGFIMIIRLVTVHRAKAFSPMGKCYCRISSEIWGVASFLCNELAIGVYSTN